MIRRSLAAALLASAFALTGCGVLDQASPGAAAPEPTSKTSTAPASDSGLGDSVKDSGDLPDPCTLLSGKQVEGLTGREVTQIDEDGEEAGAATRYCQWQQAGGQVDIFLTRTTEAEFQTTSPEAEPVDGVGDDAYQLGGHLFVRYGTVSIDVYSRGDSDEENLSEAKTIAEKVIPQI
jgi:hypothetical protein